MADMMALWQHDPVVPPALTEQPEVEGWLQTEGKDGKDNLSLS